MLRTVVTVLLAFVVVVIVMGLLGAVGPTELALAAVLAVAMGLFARSTRRRAEHAPQR